MLDFCASLVRTWFSSFLSASLRLEISSCVWGSMVWKLVVIQWRIEGITGLKQGEAVNSAHIDAKSKAVSYGTKMTRRSFALLPQHLSNISLLLHIGTLKSFFCR